jgi:hypothetical protein
MSIFSRFAVVALLLAGASGTLGACQSLAGIEDRKFDGVVVSEQCQQYCALAADVCSGTHAIYTDPKTCLATCALMPSGDIEEAPNSVACRIDQLNAAKQDSEASTLPTYCANAGPGGNGVCGSNCDSYCTLYAAACEEDLPDLQNQYDQKTCRAKCAGLNNLTTFDAKTNYSGDTLQCRLVHTSAASVDPVTHCPHAQLQAQGQAKPEPGPCVDDPDTTQPDCGLFCRLEMAECSDDFAQYESTAQCLAVCKALPLGAVTNISENTVGCRKYHSYNALIAPQTHCSHTGPGGNGHCGSSDQPSPETVSGNCESYCLLASKACAATVSGVAKADTFETNYKTLDACQLACDTDPLPGAEFEAGYAISPAPTGNNLQCRFLHVARALEKPDTAADECPAIFGGGDCQ